MEAERTINNKQIEISTSFSGLDDFQLLQIEYGAPRKPPSWNLLFLNWILKYIRKAKWCLPESHIKKGDSRFFQSADFASGAETRDNLFHSSPYLWFWRSSWGQLATLALELNSQNICMDKMKTSPKVSNVCKNHRLFSTVRRGTLFQCCVVTLCFPPLIFSCHVLAFFNYVRVE